MLPLIVVSYARTHDYSFYLLCPILLRIQSLLLDRSVKSRTSAQSLPSWKVPLWGICIPFGMWDLSSLTRDWTQVPHNARWILNHWTTREVLVLVSCEPFPMCTYMLYIMLYLFLPHYPWHHWLFTILYSPHPAPGQFQQYVLDSVLYCYKSSIPF